MNKNRKGLIQKSLSTSELLFLKKRRREKRARILVTATRIKNILNDDGN